MARASDWSPVDMDSDPTPGDPEEVRTLAEDLQEFADDVGEALAQIRGMASDRAVQDWSGLSADAFRGEFDGVPENLTKLQTSYDMAADALARYWPELQRAQAQADRALDRAIAAQADLRAAQTELGGAEDWVGRAGEEAERLQEEGEDPEPPSESEIRSAMRDHDAAEAAASAAQGRVDAAQADLSAARELAQQAKEMREEAARICARDIEAASDAGIQNRSWWEDAIDWVVDNWDTIVDIAKLVVAVLGVVVMIIGGPLAWVVLAAALIVLADTLIKYARGEASLFDVAMAALDCIPGMKGLTTLGGLASGAALLARGGLRGMALGMRGVARNGRRMVTEGARGAYDRTRSIVRNIATDPVDLASGAMYLPQTDIRLPGSLPLAFRRRAESGYHAGHWFGPSWASTVDQRLELDSEGVVFLTEDGLLLTYPMPQDPDIPVLPDTGPRLPLTRGHDGGLAVFDPLTGHRRLFTAPDAAGTALLRRIVDRNGASLTFDHDVSGAPTGIRHSAGYHLRLTTEGGRVTGLYLADPDDDSLVPIRAYHYDDGNLTAVTCSTGQSLRFSYDDRLRITGWTDSNNRSYGYRYDHLDRCVAEGGEEGHLTLTFSYDGTDPAWPGHRVTTSTTAEGAVRRFVVDDRCRVVAEVDPCGAVATTEYDDRNDVTARTDPLGNVTRYAYTPMGLPLSEARPDGSTVIHTHDPAERTTTVIRPNGGRWLRTFDARGNCVAVTDPADATTRYTYDEAGHLSSVTDPLGATTTTHCNAAGLPVEITDPLGNRSTQRYDAFGRSVEITDPLGQVTRTRWTVDGLLARLTRPDGAEQTWEYDGEGNCVRYTDAAGGVTAFTYTHFDMPASRTGPDGTRHTFSYDSALRLVSVADSEAGTWRYAYDPAGRLIAEEDWDGRRVSYRRDAMGRITERVNALGQTTAYAYDAAGRTASKTAGGITTRYTYDAEGLLLRAEAPGCHVTFARDALGRVTAETVNGRTLAFTLDAAGQRTSRTTPEGVRTAYSYDPAGLPTEVTTAGRTLAFRHDPLGRQTTRTIGDTLTLAQRWNAGNALAEQTLIAAARTVQHRAYTYRPDGALTAAADLLRGETRYTLDAAARVTAVEAQGWSEAYAYDAVGDQRHASWPSRQAGAAALGERERSGTTLTRAGATHYRYDAAGRVVERRSPKGTWHYAWDAEDRLTSVGTPDGSRWHYRYDPFGRRVAKEHRTADGTSVIEETTFTWDGDTLVEQVGSVPGSPGPIALTWEYDGFRPLTQTERRTDPATRAEIDSRFFVIVTDLMGSPAELVDESGTVAWQSRTTLWGITAWPVGSTAHTPLRFPGQYDDPESGLHYNRHRYYDPAIARYLSPDPLGLEPSPHPFGYPPNPLLFIDPLGLSAYGGFRGRMRAWFGGEQARIRDADQRMRAERTPMRLGDLEGIELPDAGDPLKSGVLRSMDDARLLEAINDPDEVGSVVTIHNDAVMQGNHRISEALDRMNDPGNPNFTPDTEILVLGRRGEETS
ncbi:DUF6531 domain-containing protein [Streptomyces radicis]|uniref:Type IV secretion protein Rhs n=1 Tax=Streptomyces radicis TaxID=1750517 RepID=A0A3A9WHR9_9ACTN|nr:DUF6531 domain-containing protein [Streptomyces radicis]RKN12515.1 hypothetical protein D7319_00685 [Streptomyces radicis]RKN27719.1 hypothetical protein D7318_02210 [Streptomyces radicis]